MTDRRRELESAALLCTARGWHVFPLLPDTKKYPLIKDWENQASTDPELIRHAWSYRPWNIGLATGPSGLVVLDLDTLKPAQTVPEPWASRSITTGAGVLAALIAEEGHPKLPATFTVATPRGGRHLYFTAPAGMELRTTNGDQGRGLGWHIDTRAGGGYVLAPGSVTREGSYRIVADHPPAPLPDWLIEKLRPAELPPQQPTPVRTTTGQRAGYVKGAVTDEVRRVETAKSGHRNAALYIAACALGQLVAGGALTEAEVTDTLLHAAEGHVAAGAYRWNEARRTIASGLKAGGRRPRSVAA